MLQTAENVAKRYGIAKERMDHYGAGSQQRACAAQEAGLFNAEIAPITVTAGVGRQGAGPAHQRGHRERGRGLAARHHLRFHQGRAHGGAGAAVVTAGNASQFSDGAGRLR